MLVCCCVCVCLFVCDCACVYGALVAVFGVYSFFVVFVYIGLFVCDCLFFIFLLGGLVCLSLFVFACCVCCWCCFVSVSFVRWCCFCVFYVCVLGPPFCSCCFIVFDRLLACYRVVCLSLCVISCVCLLYLFL